MNTCKLTLADGVAVCPHHGDICKRLNNLFIQSDLGYKGFSRVFMNVTQVQQDEAERSHVPPSGRTWASVDMNTTGT